jgi:tetratricopeptide (TPR) repeat protein
MKYLLLVLLFSCGTHVVKKDIDRSEDLKDLSSNAEYKASSDTFELSDPSSISQETLEWNQNKVSDTDLQGVAIKKCLNGDSASGLEMLSQAQKVYQKQPSYWNAIGICFFRNKEFFRAKQFFNISLSLDKKYAPALNNLALLSMQKKMWYEALSLLQSAHQAREESQVVNFNLGRVYLAFGHFKEALYHFNSIRDEAFVSNYVVKYVGIAQAALGLYSDSIKNLEAAYRKDAGSNAIKIFLALSYLEVGNKAKSLELGQGLNIRPDDGLYFYFQKLRSKING